MALRLRGQGGFPICGQCVAEDRCGGWAVRAVLKRAEPWPAEEGGDGRMAFFAHACRLGAEGIVLKKVDSAYQSGPCRVWIKVHNPASIAVQRERSEVWNP